MSQHSTTRPCKVCGKRFEAPRRSRQICEPCAKRVGLPDRTRRYREITYHAPSLPALRCLDRPIIDYTQDSHE